MRARGQEEPDAPRSVTDPQLDIHGHEELAERGKELPHCRNPGMLELHAVERVRVRRVEHRAWMPRRAAPHRRAPRRDVAAVTGATTPRLRVEPIVVRYLGAEVQLECACGLRITQPIRAAIAERCIDAKCGRPWR